MGLACCGLALAACNGLPQGVLLGTPPAMAASAASASSPAAPASAAVGLSAASADPADAAARDWLAWHGQLRALSPDALGQEIARLSDGPATPPNSMRLALALTIGRGGAELQRALGLLDQVQRSAAPDAKVWQGWARTLANRLQEQRRLEEQLDRQAQQLRENQRRIDQLNEKLEALRAIERSLNRSPAREGR
jgi:hypothetical protein